MKKRYALTLLGIGVVVFAALWAVAPYEAYRVGQEKEAFAEYLANHPYNNRVPMTPEEIKAIPKYDRPDLAAEHDFMLTMDPALKTVPKERLWAANAMAMEIKQTIAQSPSLATTSVTDAWTERGPNNIGGRTRAIMFDPNDGTNKKVWAGGVNGGLWYTTDITNGTQTWVSQNDFWTNMAVSTMAYDPTNTQVFYVGTGEGWFNADAVRGAGIFKTTNGGTSFSQLANTANSTFDYVQKIVVDPATGDVYAATRDGGIQRSEDGGTSWTQVLGTGTITATDRAADIEVAADGDLYVSMGMFSTDGIYHSPAGATLGDVGTWTKMNTGANGFPTTNIRRIELATAPSDADVVYAVAQDGGAAVENLYRSDDGGATWTTLTKPVDADVSTITPADFSRGQAWYDLILGVHPTDDQTVFVGAIDVFRSTDGGATWTQISIWATSLDSSGNNIPYMHADQHAIVFRPGSPSEMVFGHDGGIDYSANGLAKSGAVLPSFTNRNDNYNVTQYYSAAQHPSSGSNIMLGGTQDNGTHRFDAAGIDFVDEVSGGDGGFAHIDQSNPSVATTAYTRNNLRRSTNGGATFSTFWSENSGLFINPTDYDDVNGFLFTNRSGGSYVWWSSLAGSPSGFSWSISGTVGSVDFTHIRVSPHTTAGSSRVFFGTSNGQIVYIPDANSAVSITPTALNTAALPSGSISCIEVGADDNHLLVTFSNYGTTSVWETTDGGTNWANKEGNLPDIPVRWALYDPNNRTRAIIATEAGVWETEDLDSGSPTWTPSTTVPTVRVDMFQYRPSDGTIMAATHGRGVFTSRFSTPLPVELASFNVITNGTDVELTWATSSETNNAGFEVEHLKQGPENTLANGPELEAPDAFSKVSFVKGNGTTTEPRSYSHKVSDLASGQHRFRLKVLDLDGSFSYSPEVEVTVELPTGYVLSDAYPNPFNPQAQFNMEVKATQQVRVAVYNALGQEVALLHDGDLPSGNRHTFRIDGTNLTSGLYFYRAIGENFNASKSVMLVK